MEPPSTVRVVIINEFGRRLRLEPLRRAIRAALQRHGRERCVVNVLLTGDQEIRALNEKFRNVDEPTDVLTFPAGDAAGDLLGDIAISVPYGERQAAARGVSLGQELAYLSIHGALHLVGFDDENEKDRAAMVAEMNVVAVGAGFKPDHEWHSILHEGASVR